MSLLFETIACNNGKLQNLEWHNARLKKSGRKLFNKNTNTILEDIEIPEFVQSGKWKCKVLYSDIIKGISFEPYTPRIIKSLSLVESSISYSNKYVNRREIDELYESKQDCDDILIIKDGFVTDTSIANILLFNGKYWVTPNTPLLEGTMRAQLIKNGIIKVEPIKKTDLFSYQKLMLVNAMNPFDEARSIPIAEAICE